jgi:peptide deformylase
MAILPLILGPGPIFKQTAEALDGVNAEALQIAQDMLDTLYEHEGLGIAGNMVGVLKRIIVVDLQDEGVKMPYLMFNPEIVKSSEETQTMMEASLCFPGAGTDITRPREITVTYLDKDGKAQTLIASELMSQVIQHEIDYLDGKTFLDFLSPMKRKIQIKKTKKYQRNTAAIAKNKARNEAEG